MRQPRLRRAHAGLALGILALAVPALGDSLDCAQIRVDKDKFDLSKLAGPHSVVTSWADPPLHVNTTYTLDICRPLSKKGDACPSGTRVCAIRHQINEGDGPGHGEITGPIIPIAGDLASIGGKEFDYQVTRLSTGEPHDDTLKPGIRLVLKGGVHTVDDKKREQRAVVEFRCNKDFEGTEGEVPAEDKYESSAALARREDTKEPPKEGESTKEHQLLKDSLNKTALRFVSYGPDKGDEAVDILHLTWETKHVCQDAAGNPDDGTPGSHWGFFTWLVIIVFLGVAAYITFGSWLNYSRYGARGWDLLPHGDTIRDVPYLLKDWIRRVLNTVQGGGSRGGYSAV